MTYNKCKANMAKEQGTYGLKTENVAINRLKLNKFNPNIVSPENETKLEESLRRNGFFKPALVREMSDGSLEIIGGEHRVLAAKRIGYESVPVVNFGKIDDKRAKEICVLDNQRYGSDDTLQLAELLESLGDPQELSSFMPYSDADIASIFSSVNIELDSLDIPDTEETPEIPKALPQQTHVILRFKVPIDDSDMVTKLIERVMKDQNFTESDSLTNAGDALVAICDKVEM